MNLNKRTMAYRLYAACYIMSKKLFGKEDTWLISGDKVNVPDNTNLCTLMRTIFVWTPVYLALFLGLVAAISYTAFVLPATLGGVMGYINTYLIPGGTIGTIVLIAWGIVVWHDKHEKNKESLAAKEARHEAGNYTLTETTAQWVTAMHDKTCPLITVVEEPVITAPVVEDATPTEKALSEEAEAAVDSIIESLDVKPPVVEPKTHPINLFLAKWLPSFWPLCGFALATVVVVLINIGMANIMEHEPVVFAKAECTGSYDVETSTGTLVCGEYETAVASTRSLDFVNDVVILKKKPYCSVEKGTYTKDTVFYCVYK